MNNISSYVTDVTNLLKRLHMKNEEGMNDKKMIYKRNKEM